MKPLSANIAAFVESLIMMVALFTNASNSLAAPLTPTAAVNPQVAQLQQQVDQLQSLANQYQAQEQQYQTQINQGVAQINQTNQQIQQVQQAAQAYQQVLTALQNRGVIQVGADGSVQVPNTLNQ
jgi:septal ring factor EnvC (AmiA/AmiB activator)